MRINSWRFEILCELCGNLCILGGKKTDLTAKNAKKKPAVATLNLTADSHIK
jgi:hypothetical protein